MNHCERCGHPLSSHDLDGQCAHSVNYGLHGRCTCDNYLRAVVSLAEMLAAALHAGPGRDAQGSFYSAQQARLVARYAEALLDETAPTNTINAVELCEGWKDAAPEGQERDWKIQSGPGGAFMCVLKVRNNKVFVHTSTTPRDAAAKSIMLAGQEGFGS